MNVPLYEEAIVAFLYCVDKKTNMLENRSIDCCYLIFTLTQLKTKKKNYP